MTVEAAPEEVFSTIGRFVENTSADRAKKPGRIVHAINPFPAPEGSEHDVAQRITMAAMEEARAVAGVMEPELEVRFAYVAYESDAPTHGLEFQERRRLVRTVLDVGAFRKKRPFPIAHDILTAAEVAPDDIFIFTNVDIAVAPGFYAFISDLFARGIDCAIINRRTISKSHGVSGSVRLMAAEVGEPHTGFDCFAMRGVVRDALPPYLGCVGISRVMLPTVHAIMAIAERPVVLLDAGVTFHLGDDMASRNNDHADYTAHNLAEVDRVFSELIAARERRERLARRLSAAHDAWVFPHHLRKLVGVGSIPADPPRPSLIKRAANRMKRELRRLKRMAAQRSG